VVVVSGKTIPCSEFCIGPFALETRPGPTFWLFLPVCNRTFSPALSVQSAPSAVQKGMSEEWYSQTGFLPGFLNSPTFAAFLNACEWRKTLIPAFLIQAPTLRSCLTRGFLHGFDAAGQSSSYPQIHQNQEVQQ